MANKIIKSRVAQNINCFNCCSRHLCIAGGSLNTSEIDYLNGLIQKVVILKKQEHLFHAHSEQKNLYAVYKGSCKEYWIDENGNYCVTNFYFPGDLIGLESISDRTHLLSVVALEPTELCVISLNDFSLMQEKVNILKRFIDITSMKMRNDRSAKMGVTAHERVSDFLLNLISRMLERNQTINHVPLPMSQLDISNFLNIAHETVNRIFKNLARQKIIKIQNKVLTVLDISELERLGRLDYSLKKD
ncbi:MAG: Crp/Fnr family transcriptional regulator [Gammaproteobacteria bacterium]|nr:Crp/Fnr family transcriptional regulator [Gammaproteobacteria bacterium]